MPKPSASDDRIPSSTTISKDVDEPGGTIVAEFFNEFAASTLPENLSTKDFYSDLIRGLLKPDKIQHGRISCFLSVKPAVTNFYGTLHGGAVAAIAETVSIACARTVVAEDKELFLGELGMSYLSAAQQNAELIVDGSIVRSGRNLTVIEVSFKLKKTGRLVYTARATFYHMPVAKL